MSLNFFKNRSRYVRLSSGSHASPFFFLLLEFPIPFKVDFNSIILTFPLNLRNFIYHFVGFSSKFTSVYHLFTVFWNNSTLMLLNQLQQQWYEQLPCSPLLHGGAPQYRYLLNLVQHVRNSHVCDTERRLTFILQLVSANRIMMMTHLKISRGKKGQRTYLTEYYDTKSE